jgi:hypothetical protein
VSEQITDHVARALARLSQQFQDKTNIAALLSAVITSGQELEDTYWDLFTERDVDNAVGQQLDDLGTIVGEARQGRADDDYRRFVRARISTNKSNGTIENVLTVTRLVVNSNFATYVLQNSGTASVVLRIEDTTTTDELAAILISFLRDVVAAGVRIVVESSEAPVADWFILDVDELDGTAVFIGATD